ncbi:cysteine--tRNA ligase [Aureibacter tunicatorum]|uniref:Cysteine--tRNA ligase n=1 Tax=Aureibacter tunicatorum TaxID=866807 RepID=A0AAE4BRH8_9BACT|nr:cysteine--tRNA ligase [Aureibacter tunicatorum]MDR6240234.1 cysteinyl-tRNA synthetase [Aureibacter tunicatorum]BDD05885.1 cysteine--tRNA ligase [Aureibacter tunicatorum]
MLTDLRIYNTLTKNKEKFESITPGHAGMYVCGPTVYSDVHLGNIRTFMSFDIVYRYLMQLGYKVRYVRNITDVGHLVGDADEGEDKIAKKAKLENLEPMEVVQKYTNGFHDAMKTFNILPPSIEPQATGHILEQIQLIQTLIDNGVAYESDGSVYFDIEKYSDKHNYGVLSGRVVEELLQTTRDLDGQNEKKNKADFALWKKAAPEHLMRWESPWSLGFPGWHLECTVMSTKYLGKTFDIHGGGMDLKFPHHECEIAQSVGSCGEVPAKYWMHTNMLTVNGQKMSKSLGNSFLPKELIEGSNSLFSKGYSPMTIRFFMLQSHYSSTLDFSDEALLSAQKGYRKLANGLKTIKQLEYTNNEAEVSLNEKVIGQINGICDNCFRAMNDDFNTAKTIAHLFNLLKKINSVNTGNLKPSEIGKDVFDRMILTFTSFTSDVLGILEEQPEDVDGLISVILDSYKEAKEAKNYDKVDKIRSELKDKGLLIKDMKDKIDWAYDEN